LTTEDFIMAGFNAHDLPVTTNYTEELSAWAAALRFADIPAEVRERAKIIILHTLGSALASTPLPQAQIAENLAQRLGGGVGAPATSWFSGKPLSPAAAAYVNGTLSDLLDWEDCSYTGHPSAALVPAILALAEELPRDGESFLTAFVVGYEVYQRIALSVGNPHINKISEKGYANGLPNWPIFASAAAAAKYYGFDADHFNQTLGMAITYHKHLTNLSHVTMSDAYHLESGFCAQTGIQAAQAVQEGITNLKDGFDIPYAYLEHFNQEITPEWLTRDLGKRWLILELLLKHWPSNMWIQTSIEIASDLVRENAINPDDIAQIIVDPSQHGRTHHRPEGYSSITDAEFSIPYCVAISILEAKPGPNWYSEANFNNPKLLDLAGKVSFTDKNPGGRVFSLFYESEGKDFPPRTVTITLQDGKVFERTQSLHKGHPADMYSWTELEEEFLHQSSFALAKNQGVALFKFVRELEQNRDTSTIGSFFRSRV
jgi:2-methylcitrate dehydratase PrpD